MRLINLETACCMVHATNLETAWWMRLIFLASFFGILVGWRGYVAFFLAGRNHRAHAAVAE